MLGLDLAVVVGGVALSWWLRGEDTHVTSLGAMAGVLGVTTFFGMLWCYPAQVADKTAVRPALAAALVLVWMILAGLFLFDGDLIDTATGRSIFGDMTLFVGSVIAFYFGTISVEKLSEDRKEVGIAKANGS